MLFAALLFSIRLAWHPSAPDTWLPLLTRTIVAFLAFCAVSAGEYIINDIHDRERDWAHPLKRRRPIACGDLSPAAATLVACTLFTVGLLLSLALGSDFMLVLAAYAALMLGYTYVIKDIVVLDVLTIAAGFVLRAVAGAVAISVPVSPWLYVCTMLGALVLAVNKRRHELEVLQAAAVVHRPSLSRYTILVLHRLSSIVMAAAAVVYSLYAVTADRLPKNHVMTLTIPFVVYGMVRYLYLVNVRGEGGSPEDLFLRDRPLLACTAGWILTSGLLLAFFR